MSLIVQKFGGSSVRDAQRIRNVAGIIAETYLAGNDVIVVLSAQGDTTDDLIAKAEEINRNPSKREMDMLLATGEQISVALCAMALEAMGLPCVSLTAWQVGIQSTTVHSDARIKKIDSERVQAELDQHRIVIVTGFQGVDRLGDITTPVSYTHLDVYKRQAISYVSIIPGRAIPKRRWRRSPGSWTLKCWNCATGWTVPVGGAFCAAGWRPCAVPPIL